MLRQSLREAFIANPKARVTAEHFNYWAGKGQCERERSCGSLRVNLLPLPFLHKSSWLIRLCLPYFSLRTRRMQCCCKWRKGREGTEEKGMQEAGVGRGCCRNGSLTLAGLPRCQQEPAGCGTSLWPVTLLTCMVSQPRPCAKGQGRGTWLPAFNLEVLVVSVANSSLPKHPPPAHFSWESLGGGGWCPWGARAACH